MARAQYNPLRRKAPTLRNVLLEQLCNLPNSFSAKQAAFERHKPKYVSQFGPGWKTYKPNISEAELKEMKDGVRSRIQKKDGKPVEGFRYYRGLPDAIGK